MMLAFDAKTIREFESLPDPENLARISEIRKHYGKELCLLAHLYQRKAIADMADFVGDSYGLSKSAASFEGGNYIVFAGVRFMAESAEILSRPEQKVIHPDPEAGCPMADMASLPEVQRAWKTICEATTETIIPVTYMNSTADIKAFCGENGGTICTSSNAVQTFRWAFERGQKIFFLPDEHLGRNTALKLGLPLEALTIWDPDKESGGENERYGNSKVILWRGHCPVHMKFTLRDVEHVRRYYPQAKVIVHPECPREVVESADAVGSTSFITEYVQQKTRPGDTLFIGTEINLIENLASEYKDRTIAKLHRSLCLTMYQITLGRLRYALEHLEELEPVSLPETTKHYSRVALNRMLQIH